MTRPVAVPTLAVEERIAVAVEAQIRHLRAVPADVTDVPRDAMAADLQMLADDIRRGRYTPQDADQ